MDRIKTGTTTKADKFNPIIHASNIKALIKSDNPDDKWDLDDFAQQITTPPNQILGTNAKMAKSKEEGAITYDLNQSQSHGDDQPYEGVVNMILRWFSETASEHIRSWAESFMQLNTCPECNGTRLKKESLHFKINDSNIAQLSHKSLQDLYNWFVSVSGNLSDKQNHIAKDILKEIKDRLSFLLDVGLHYLTLDRPTRTLSGGESQRIRLATQIGSQLTGITYILDEPSIGLHQRDNVRLIKALQQLRDSGNSVLVVEHDKDIMLASDYLIDIGPAAGFHGGRIVSSGHPTP
jgi:excinuclease ABC subunit A